MKEQGAERQGTQFTIEMKWKFRKGSLEGVSPGMIPGSARWGKGETEFRITRAKPSGHAHVLHYTFFREGSREVQ